MACAICGANTPFIVCTKETCKAVRRHVYSNRQKAKKRAAVAAQPMRHCEFCGEDIGTYKNRTVCTNTTCKRKKARAHRAKYAAAHPEKIKQLGRSRTERKHKEQCALGETLVHCAICGLAGLVVNYHHLASHGLTAKQYRALYPEAPIATANVQKSKAAPARARAAYHSYNGVEPDEKLAQFLVGALLGDGNLSVKNKTSNARYAEGGSNAQYILWKGSFLARYIHVRTKEKLSAPHTKTKKRYRGWWIRSGVHPRLTEWYWQWYPQGKKIVPRELVRAHLTEFALSVWYCDDGHHKGDFLYTLAFSEEDVEFLRATMLDKFGLVTKIQFIKGKPVIHLPAASRKRLITILQPLPGMEYKFKFAGGLHAELP